MQNVKVLIVSVLAQKMVHFIFSTFLKSSLPLSSVSLSNLQKVFPFFEGWSTPVSKTQSP